MTFRMETVIPSEGLDELEPDFPAGFGDLDVGPDDPEPEIDPEAAADSLRADMRAIRLAVTLLAVVGTTIFTLIQVHPEKILENNTPTGGDMGAHVWAPAFLRDHLLPHFRLQGWSMDWYAGLPVYRFYMLPPALLMTILNSLGHVPYGVAFKIVAVLGVVSLPINCWAFGRLARFAWPIPEFMALGAVLFLFDENFTIYGGNIASTMAGEFSFAMALSLAMLGLGLLSRGLDTGRGLGMAAAVLALAAVCHGIVAIFVGLGAILMVLIWADKTRWKWGLATLGTLGLLTAWWILPFKLSTHYMTNMKYEPYTGPWWKFFNPQSQQTTIFLMLFSIIGFVASIVRRQRAGAFLGVTCLIWVALVRMAAKPLPIVGDLFWNYRGLPFIFLLRYLLAVIGVAETVKFLLRYVQLNRAARVEALPEDSAERVWLSRKLRPERIDAQETLTQFAAIGVIGLIMVGWVAFGIDRLPWQKQIYENGQYLHQWGFIKGAVVNDGADSDGWALYNFNGYEGRETWNEYRALLDTSNQIGAGHGCGRAIWEHQSDKYGNYGTPMALMLLPFWTDGCIQSMEGLFFEASATTPYHFLTASAVSENASDPVRQLRYDKDDLDLGVPYMRNLGIRYYYAFTPDMVTKAAKRDDLTEIAVSGPWHIYEVKDFALVVPLTTEPLVVKGRGGDARERWLEVGTSYFQHPNEWKGVLVADGPKEWQRIEVFKSAARSTADRVDILQTNTPNQAIEEPAFTIDPATVKLGQSSISFDVPEAAIGHPVLVRVSYVPNWTAHGAKGPYRAAPNFMVVVPTSTHVSLTYGYSTLDLGSYGLTIVGIGLLVFFWRGRKVDFTLAPAPEPGIEPEPSGDPEPSGVPAPSGDPAPGPEAESPPEPEPVPAPAG
jgi:hypothetical protein